MKVDEEHLVKEWLELRGDNSSDVVEERRRRTQRRRDAEASELALKAEDEEEEVEGSVAACPCVAAGLRRGGARNRRDMDEGSR